MNRRDFIKGVATAAAALVVPRHAAQQQHQDWDRLVEENKVLRERIVELEIDVDIDRKFIDQGYKILKDISGSLLDHGFPWAFYWRALAGQVERVCQERDSLRLRIAEVESRYEADRDYVDDDDLLIIEWVSYLDKHLSSMDTYNRNRHIEAGEWETGVLSELDDIPGFGPKSRASRKGQHAST